MASSDMSLNIIRNIAGYNNEILVATDDLSICLNKGINTQIIPQDVSTGEKGVVITQTQDKPTTSTKPNTSPTTPATTPGEPSAQDHNDNKAMLILLGLLGGGALMMLTS